MPKITQPHEDREFFIYALVCPLTSEVRYVGQTKQPKKRFAGEHGTGKGTSKGPLGEWLRTLGHMKPYRVILERGINRRVMLPSRVDFRGRTQAAHETWLSSCVEAKWLKRFRRTIINVDKVGSISGLLLVNPPLPWETDATPAEGTAPTIDAR